MSTLAVRRLGQVEYWPTFEAMRDFTSTRGPQTDDEVWLCEHPPVFTQGLSGKAEHVLRHIDIPVVQVDRGGQVTYHGPGQLVAYLMIDLRRRELKVRELVHRIEQAIIDLLDRYGVQATRRDGAPGVYVAAAKVAALGLRIRNGCSYHGMSINVNMDLSPFAAINPCGYAGLAVTQLADLGVPAGIDRVGDDLVIQLNRTLL